MHSGLRVTVRVQVLLRLTGIFEKAPSISAEFGRFSHCRDILGALAGRRRAPLGIGTRPIWG